MRRERLTFYSKTGIDSLSLPLKNVDVWMSHDQYLRSDWRIPKDYPQGGTAGQNGKFSMEKSFCNIALKNCEIIITLV